MSIDRIKIVIRRKNSKRAFRALMGKPTEMNVKIVGKTLRIPKVSCPDSVDMTPIN